MSQIRGFSKREQAIIKILATLQASSLSDEEVNLVGVAMEGLMHEKSITGLSSKIVLKNVVLEVIRSFDDGFSSAITMRSESKN
jgi:hypothetical protein